MPARRDIFTPAGTIPLVACLMALFLALAGCDRRPAPPRVDNGRLDLSAWDFATGGPVRLFGDWECVWGRLLSPETAARDDAPESRDFLAIPGLWRGRTARGLPLAAKGQTTYRLRLRLPADHPPLSLFLTGALSVCAIWIDDVPLTATGTPGLDAASEHPLRHERLADLPPGGATRDLVLQVSNHHNVLGGLKGDLCLGERETLSRMFAVRRIGGAFMAGALACMSLYHLVLYCRRRQERSNLYFGLFCLLWSWLTGFNPACGFLMEALVPRFPWSWYITCSLLPYGLTIPLMLYFYQSLFPKRYGTLVNRFFLGLGLATMAYSLANAPNAYDPVLFFYFLLTRLAFLYLFACFALDIRRREAGAWLLVPGYLALAWVEFDDILFDSNIINSADFGPYGVFVFILSYSLFLSARFARAFFKVETLSAELELRQRTEQGLRLTQRRLASLLDSLDDALLVVNRSREVTYCNQAFADLIGQPPGALLGSPLADLLARPPSPATQALLDALADQPPPPWPTRVFPDVRFVRDGREGPPAECGATGIELAGEPLVLLVARPPGTRDDRSPAQAPMAMLRELDANRQRLLKLEEALLSLESAHFRERQAVLADLKALDSLLEHLAGLSPGRDRPDARRRLAARVMNLALACWSAETGTGKVELAEQSRLWTVYVEKDGYCRTQTLDKYLSEQTLPARPRWRDIHATAEFVLANCSRDRPLYKALEEAFTALTALA